MRLNKDFYFVFNSSLNKNIGFWRHERPILGPGWMVSCRSGDEIFVLFFALARGSLNHPFNITSLGCLCIFYSILQLDSRVGRTL